MPRLFIAIPLSKELRSSLAETAQELAPLSPDTSWVGTERIHITMRFLGEVSETAIPKIEGAMDSAVREHPPFPFEVCGLGAFPSPRRPRVLWAGIKTGKEEMTALHRSLSTELEGVGFPQEERPFSAHITLGRVRRPRTNDQLADRLKEEAETVFGGESVERLVLFKSTLLPQGAVYDELYSANLKG